MTLNQTGLAMKIISRFCLGTIILAFGLSTHDANAQTKKTRYSSMVDWNLKAENLKPTGINPYYQPLIPGHRYVMENPNFNDDGVKGSYRKTVEVMHETKSFDIAAIGGKFECAIVEEKEFLDGKQFSFSKNYYCFDRTTGTIYTAGENASEASSGKRGTNFDMADTESESWIVGEPDDNGEIEMGLIFPGTWLLGSRWIIDGAEGKAFVGGEAAESGLTMNTPAGNFENCVRTREYDIIDPEDVTDKVWCYGVGLVFDTSDGLLAKTSHLDGKLPQPSPYYAYHKNKDKMPASVKKEVVKNITEDQAKAIALSAVPGKVTDIEIERKLGGKRYVVEVRAAKDNSEIDVIIDMQNGKVLATED